MSIRKFISSAAVSVLMLFAVLPARAGIPAGIPVLDGANLAQAIQAVLAWGQQARQMVDQYTQLQAMTGKLDGARSLGTILNNPNIQTALPPEMRDSTYLLLNPSTPATSAANLNQILTSFGVNTTVNPNAGQAAADTLGRAQQILASTQTRQTQLQALASRVDSTADAKDSLDMMNRNALEAASINNQMTQTMASLEAARQAAELKRLAENQAYFAGMRAGAAQPLRTFTY
jgi:type IV secretion system protein VirB5